MAFKRLSLTRGDSRTYTLTFKDQNGAPFCLKNWVIFFTIKTNWSVPDSEALVQKIITTFSDTTSGTSGIAEIILNPADTVNIEPGEYCYDIAVTTSQSLTYTALKGQFDLEWDVTRTPGTAGTA